MIVTETVDINGTSYLHTYSDAGYMIERDGVQYGDAIDPIDSGREYTETDVKVDRGMIIEDINDAGEITVEEADKRQEDDLNEQNMV